MKKLENKKVIGIFVVIILLIIGIGGKLYMDKQAFNNEMVAIVRSEEAKDEYSETINNIDPSAFTAEGVIQSYKIDRSSISHSPMGRIMLKLIINNDDNLIIYITLTKEVNGKLRNSSGGLSAELSEKLRGSK